MRDDALLTTNETFCLYAIMAESGRAGLMQIIDRVERATDKTFIEVSGVSLIMARMVRRGFAVKTQIAARPSAGNPAAVFAITQGGKVALARQELTMRAIQAAAIAGNRAAKGEGK